MRDFDEFDQVQTLIATGMNDCAIARQTGIPRTTVHGWRSVPPRRLVDRDRSSSCGVDHDFTSRDLVDQATEQFIVGLIHSDGCRVVANDRGVTSVRYHFSNMSEDILNLFTGALDQLGIHWRRSSKKQLSIYRKADTARLDEFIGPKSRPVPWPCIELPAS